VLWRSTFLSIAVAGFETCAWGADFDSVSQELAAGQ
jgi:hypothetical protein